MHHLVIGLAIHMQYTYIVDFDSHHLVDEVHHLIIEYAGVLVLGPHDHHHAPLLVGAAHVDLHTKPADAGQGVEPKKCVDCTAQQTLLLHMSRQP
jgi:hypothetical protein